VLAAGVLSELVQTDHAAGVHILDALANTFKYPRFFGRLSQLLIRCGVLAFVVSQT
jgi:hypothetical protein